MADNETNSGRRSTRGFASMDPAKRREIAKKGGHAAHQKGTAHEFTPEEARAAGRKGGERSRASHNSAANDQGKPDAGHENNTDGDHDQSVKSERADTASKDTSGG
jgi:general stress protein YciG